MQKYIEIQKAVNGCLFECFQEGVVKSDIKKTGNRPMVIHLKKRAEFHVKGMPKTRGKTAGKYRIGAARQDRLSVRGVQKAGRGIPKDGTQKTEEKVPEKQAVSKDTGFKYGRRASPHSSQYLPDNRRHLSSGDQNAETSGQISADDRCFFDGSRDVSGGDTGKVYWKKNTGYREQDPSVLQQRQTGQAVQRPAGGKNSFAGAAATAGAKTSSKQVEGGDEFYDACMTADILAEPVKSAADCGRDLYRRQAMQKSEKRIKKVWPGNTVGKKEAAVEKGNFKTGPVPEISKTAPKIRIHKKVSAPGISGAESGMPKPEPVPGGSGTTSVKKSGTGSRRWRNSRTVSEAGAADKTDRKISRAADGSATKIPCAPVSGRRSVRTASIRTASVKTGPSQKTDISGPAAAPETDVFSISDGIETKMPETAAVPGAGISRVPEKKPERKFSGKKTDIHIPGKALKQKNPAVPGKPDRIAAGTAGGRKNDSAAGRPAGFGTARRGMKNSVRNRMIQLFISRQRQEKNRDDTDRLLKDFVMLNFSAAMKHAAGYAGLFLAGIFLLTALLSFPVMAVLAVIYNSPFAICFPSISSAETTQQVLSACMEEFCGDVEAELDDTAGYDRSERIYVNFTGDGIPDNYCDILAVYMVKYGNGDTATDMTDRAGRNLKSVFDDMCSYTVSAGTETAEDEEGNETVCKVKYVNVELKTWQETAYVYGFSDEEQEMLAELMKPENTALMGYSGAGGGQQEAPGQQILPEQYQAAVDAVSDERGKKVLEFALSKVGYPYSQPLRDSGTHFDCSSLAFYAWQNAGVNISYQGSTTAASEAQLCYDSSWLVHYDEMKPGDLIFYSYHKNGRFMDITHVAVYAGNGMAVEAANTRLGVVYRTVTGKDSIVMIGRPGLETGRGGS